MHDIDRHAIMSQNDIQHTSIKDEATLSQMVCRICSTEQQNDDSMNNLLTSDHNGLYFVDMLHDCLQRAIPRDNGFPLNICLDCTSKLIVVYNFRLMYNASQKKFTEMLGYSCKSEGLEPKVDVIIDESESDDVKPRFFFDWAAFDVPIAPPTTCDGINDISNCETGLKFEPHTEVKLNKLRVQRYECYQCKTMFKRITYLRKHMKNLHDTADKCWSDCHKRYSHRKQLVDHLNKHKTRQNCNDEKETLTSETPQSTFLCSECGKTFKNKWLLTSHQNVHSTEKQFVCSKCPSRFKWKLALTYHMTIHQRQDRQKHVCDTCGKSYATRSSMKAHASKLNLLSVLFRCFLRL